MKFTDETMHSDLDKFGEPYSYPVYVSVVDMNSSFSSSMNQKQGFAAISDSGKLLLIQYSIAGMLGMGEPVYLDFSSLCLESVKISDMGFLPSYIVKIVFRVNGKKLKYRLTIAKKVLGGQLNEQEMNCEGFINTLKKWRALI